MTAMLSEFTQHVQVDAPERAFSPSGHHVIEADRCRGSPRRRAGVSIGSLNGLDGVAVVDDEGLIRSIDDADLLAHDRPVMA